MIQVTHLQKSFRVHKKAPGLWGSLKSTLKREWLDKDALRDITLKIHAGEIVGLVGANGAGKTTLVKILSGIIHPTSGEAQVLGFQPWQRDIHFRKQIALVMGQKAQLWWDLPAQDCFTLLREIYQIPQTLFQKNLDYLVKSLEVRNQLNIQIRRLSLGERMKMELIAALLHQPKVIFLDEPTIGLDFTAQKAIRKFLLQYRLDHNPIMILTSHYMEDIESLCERIIILRQGKLVYDGSLKVLSNQYAPHKILRLVIEESAHSKFQQFCDSHQLKIHLQEGNVFNLRVEKEKVSAIASKIFSQINLLDIGIQEEDISLFIEEIMRHGTRP